MNLESGPPSCLNLTQRGMPLCKGYLLFQLSADQSSVLEVTNCSFGTNLWILMAMIKILILGTGYFCFRRNQMRAAIISVTTLSPIAFKGGLRKCHVTPQPIWIASFVQVVFLCFQICFHDSILTCPYSCMILPHYNYH